MNPIERLRARMSEHDIPALLVNDIGNVQWMTGFTGSFGFVLLTPTGGCFLTDARYTIQAAEQVKDLEVVSYASPKKVEEVLAEQAATLGEVTRELANAAQGAQAILDGLDRLTRTAADAAS